jgi:hypothetical protein
MIKGCTYVIPHTCYVGQWSTPDDGGYEIFGREVQCFELSRIRFDSVSAVQGFRCIGLVERVRDHWVIDTWLECAEGDTRKQVKLLSHKYLKQLLRNAELWSEK